MAYEFNGTTQYLDANFQPPTGAAERTVSAWFRCTTFGDKKIFSYGTNVNGQSFAFTLEEVSASPFVLFRHFGGNIRYPASGTNVWQHLACVVPIGAATTDNVLVYLNGALATGTRNGGSDQTLNTAAANLIVGAQIIAGISSSFFNGQIAEIGAWDVALSGAEIASLAKGMACDKVRPQSLVFYAPLVRDLIDVRGGRAITNNNTATVANHPRIYQ
jgi:hypothetical protein